MVPVMTDVIVISDSDSNLECLSTVSQVVFTPTKRPPSPGTSDEGEDFEDINRYILGLGPIKN